MKNKRFGLLAAIALGLGFCPGAAAQDDDDVSMFYDTANRMILVGEIVEAEWDVEWVEWPSPRARLHVRDESSNRIWLIVSDALNELSDEQRASVRVGEAVRVTAFQSRDKVCIPDCNAYGVEFAKADGSPLAPAPSQP